MTSRFVSLLLTVALLLLSTAASAAHSSSYTVRRGDTLSGIAKHHHVSVAKLCRLNHIARNRRIHPGMKLRVPGHKKDVKPTKTPSKQKPTPPPPPANLTEQTLRVPGAPDAYYYEPIGRGRLSRRPIIVYLHGRGGKPQLDCLRWSKVARRFGWLLCPSGQEDRGEGRGWDNNWPAGQRVVMASVRALVRKYPKRVQRFGNTLIGFSEGAFVAMNIGPRQSRTFNRWFVLAASTKYWGGMGRGLLARARRRVRRVYLITGQLDGTFHSTERVATLLRRARIPVRVVTPTDMGHQVLLEQRPQLYRRALSWLSGGTKRHRKRKSPVNTKKKSPRRHKSTKTAKHGKAAPGASSGHHQQSHRRTP